MTQTPENQQQYGSILTILGENAEQNGKLQNKQITFTHMAIGDANDEYVQPNRKQTALVNELARIPINSVDVLQPTPDSVPMLKVEAILPDDVNDLVIREFAAVATFDGNTYFHAVGNNARIYVPPPVNNGNVSTPVTLEMIFVITSAEPIVEIDPNIVTASREYSNQSANSVNEQSVGGVIYPLNVRHSAKAGDVVPTGITCLRDGRNNRLYNCSPSPISGDISSIDFDAGEAVVGGIDIELYPVADVKLQRAIDIPFISKFMEGQLVRWLGYYQPSDGGSNWGIVCKGPHIHDGFSIFSIDHNTYVRANLKGKSLNIRKAGAKGDKTTDDTDKIKLVISYAENNVVSRWDSGLTVRIPEGDFLISATLRITTSNIGLWGRDWSSCVLYAPDADFDLVHFDGTTQALYGCSGGKFRFNTPGNSNNGTHLRTTKLINSDFSSLYYVGYHKGLVSDGCARTYYSNQIFSQETRDHNTSPSYAMDFTSYNGANNSDVHINTYQIFMPDDRKCRYSVSIRGGDGIYFNDGHQQGGTLVQPDGEGTKVCASVYWNRVYMDKADAENIIFTRGSEIYRNFQFNSTYLRGSERGLVFDTTSNIEKIKYIGGEVSGHTKSGIECRNDKVRKLKVVGADFDTNCSDNVLGDSDIIVRGNGHVISANNFSGGSSNGRAVNLTNESSNCIVCSNDFSESTQDIRLINSGYENKIGVNTGVTFKNKGTATVVKGSRRVTVPHGMTQSPTYDAFQITPRTEITPAQSFWLENVTSDSFDIVLTADVANNAVFSWLCDMTS
ncbi:phage tail protein [Vibrio parahaemolyticus]|nr:phage tail protein [Vibrio parahaemolyticus]